MQCRGALPSQAVFKRAGKVEHSESPLLHGREIRFTDAARVNALVAPRPVRNDGQISPPARQNAPNRQQRLNKRPVRRATRDDGAARGGGAHARQAAQTGPIQANRDRVRACSRKLRAGRTRFSIDDKTPLPKFFARSNLDPDSSSDDSSDSPSPSSAEPNNKRGFRARGCPTSGVVASISTATTPQFASFFTEKGFVVASAASLYLLNSPRMKCECDTTSGALQWPSSVSYWTSLKNSAARRSTALLPSRRSDGSHHSPAASRARAKRVRYI